MKNKLTEVDVHYIQSFATQKTLEEMVVAIGKPKKLIQPVYESAINASVKKNTGIATPIKGVTIMTAASSALADVAKDALERKVNPEIEKDIFRYEPKF